ncbi:MAG: hypothetical protein IJ093_04180 [Bacilli bacterium]|nr:hypothetical protein [Bacilli bacterium]
MSFLEYLGLEYIFNSMDNKNSSDSATGCGGILFIVGVLGWLLLAIFRSSLIDKAAVVFNLIAFICIIISLGIKFYFAKKNNELNIGFLVASILVIIISFFIGSRSIYHSAIYNYEYNHICSGIAYTFCPTVILNFLFPFFCHYKKEKMSSIIGRAFGSIGLSILIIVVIFFIGQAITVAVYFTGNENVYEKFVTYHNLQYNSAREEFKDMNLEDRLKTIYLKAKENANNRCNEYSYIDDCSKYKRENYKEVIASIAGTYGYSIVRNYSINDNEDAIKVSDKEYNTSFSYYIFNKNDYTINPINEEQFNDYYNQN